MLKEVSYNVFFFIKGNVWKVKKDQNTYLKILFYNYVVPFIYLLFCVVTMEFNSLVNLGKSLLILMSYKSPTCSLLSSYCIKLELFCYHKKFTCQIFCQFYDSFFLTTKSQNSSLKFFTLKCTISSTKLSNVRMI